jgi:tellurite resistance protein
VALARVGGGEHFDSGRGSDSGDASGLFDVLAWLVFNVPCVGIPLLLVLVGYFVYQRTQGESSTRKALDQAEAERRTTTSSTHVANWVAALKAKDPQFDVLPLLDRVRRLFLEVQEAWFKRDLGPVRRFLSDGTAQRLATQLEILRAQGVRDAIADPRVIDLQLIGLEQTPSFDTVHVRVTATVRDTDVSASVSDDEARAQAQHRTPDRFIEVWSFVRRPGAQSRPGDDPGACPNCGAPFTGGATNQCDHCRAIVNSGAYDWVVAEITQGSEHHRAPEAPDGLARARQTDPDLSTEMLEDRASLVFWKWVDAQVHEDASHLAKLATVGFTGALTAELEALRAADRRRVLSECAVGAAHTRALDLDGALELAFVELKWSARIGVVARGSQAAGVPTRPLRSVLVLQRKAGATTSTANGLATNRCPSCGAPLSDNGQATCEYCGVVLSGGEGDWVLREVLGWEQWQAVANRTDRPRPVVAKVADRDERERLVYLMAALAASDGVVDRRERSLLRMTADRWGIPWSNVELALGAGPGLFEKLMAKGSVEAEVFLRELVAMALVDGKIDVNERKMLDAAASHLGMGNRLSELLGA